MAQTFELTLQTFWNRKHKILDDITEEHINTKINQKFLLYYKQIDKILEIYDINSLNFLA